MMSLNLKLKLVLILFVAMALSACSTSKTSDGGAIIEDRQGTEFSEEPLYDEDGVLIGGISDGTGVEGAETRGVDGSISYDIEELNNPNSILAERIIYFALDSNLISDEYTLMIEAHARFLAENPDANVILEGHTDERGTREYNLALGERRAQSVRDYLLLQGASLSQIETISYGEERPARFDKGEGSWAENRRVEIIYQGL